jgi:hypothetical protein
MKWNSSNDSSCSKRSSPVFVLPRDARDAGETLGRFRRGIEPFGSAQDRLNEAVERLEPFEPLIGGKGGLT